MSIVEEVGVGCDSPVEKLEQALQKQDIGGKYKKAVDFAEAYPIIEQHLSRKVPMKVVIETFGEACGYVIHAPRFRQLLQAERKRRAEAGEVVVCSACGQHLPAAIKAVEDAVKGEEQTHVE